MPSGISAIKFPSSFVCDLCKVKRFSTLEEAEEHEKNCSHSGGAANKIGIAAVVDVENAMPNSQEGTDKSRPHSYKENDKKRKHHANNPAAHKQTNSLMNKVNCQPTQVAQAPQAAAAAMTFAKPATKAPERPRNPPFLYDLFCADATTSTMKDVLANKSEEECNHILTKKWSIMTDKEKKKYFDQRHLLHVEHFKAMRQYQKDLLKFRLENPELDSRVSSPLSSATKKSQSTFFASSTMKAGHSPKGGKADMKSLRQPIIQNHNKSRTIGHNLTCVPVVASFNNPLIQEELGLKHKAKSIAATAASTSRVTNIDNHGVSLKRNKNSMKHTVAPPIQPQIKSPTTASLENKLRVFALLFDKARPANNKSRTNSSPRDNIISLIESDHEERPTMIDNSLEGRGENGASAANVSSVHKQNSGAPKSDIICIDIDDDDDDGDDIRMDSCVSKQSSHDTKKDCATSQNKGNTSCVNLFDLAESKILESPPKQSSATQTSIDEANTKDMTLRELSNPEKSKLPSQISLRAAIYPIGCPVWFNMQYSKPCSRYLEADRGIVKQVSLDSCAQKIVYEVERKRKREEARSEIFVVAEDELAFSPHCPVHVTMEDGGNSAMEGKVMNVKPGIRKDGKVKITYTVMVTTEEDKERIEEGIVAERVRYQLSLKALRLSLKDTTPFSRNQKMVAIRSNDRDEPIRNKAPPVISLKKRQKLAVACSGDNTSSDDSESSDEEGCTASESEEETSLKHVSKKRKQNLHDPAFPNTIKKKKTISYRGLTYRKKCNSYETRIDFKCKRYILGVYKFQAEGALAYDVGAKILKGSGCHVNFSTEEEYELAIRNEIKTSGQSVNVAESYNAVLQRVKENVTIQQNGNDEKPSTCSEHIDVEEDQNQSADNPMIPIKGVISNQITIVSHTPFRMP